ncbi:AAA family ATPase [Candidatus Poribacteria bacterium]|nr:AAA family ATPase [Candidatus Poribacteria bacterium]
MRSIAIFNNKGGVGKTTLLCNLAAYFAQHMKKHVLVIDADPQCNATQSIVDDDEIERLYEKHKGFTLWDVLDPLIKGKGYVQNLEFHKSEHFGLDLLPGDPRMSLIEDVLASDWLQGTAGDVRGLRTTLVFANLLSRCRNYDYVFFDMGPSLGAINRAVLIASDFFVIPTSIDIFSLLAISNISTGLIKWRKKFGYGLGEVEDHNELEVGNPQWTLRFAGYVTQQYITRRKGGKSRAVKAYERILQKMPRVIYSNIVEKYGGSTDSNVKLGSIPYFHSLVPMSQISHKPIFTLQSQDGVVGAHFSKVREFEEVIAEIAGNLERNCEELS